MSCQKCGSTDTYCGCDEATAIAERDAALAELEKLNTRVCELAGLTVERCPVNFYQDAITALENTGARWVIRRNKDGYSVKVWTRGHGSHPRLCVAICQAIAGIGRDKKHQ